MKRTVLLLFLITNAVMGWASAPDTTNYHLKKDSASSIVSRLGDDTPSKDSTFIIPARAETAPLFETPDILADDIAPVENDSIQRYIDLARAVLAQVKKTQNFIKTIDANTNFKLPVGISKTIGGLTYEIGIHAVRLKPSYAELDVFMRFVLPQDTSKVLTFMAKGIKLSNKGGIIGDAKLMLLSDNAINFSGNKVQLMIKGKQGGTYVTMDCDGFKEMGLDADVIFSRDLLLPENLNGTVQPVGHVTASFKTVISNWNDLVVQLTMPDFQVTGLNDVGFSIRDAVFDFSDLRNAPNVKFPQGYTSTQMLPDNQNLWRGIYIRQLSVRLPNQFSKKNESGRTTFDGYDLIIDQMGFTGTVVGKNLIGLNNGDMNGWAYSLDSLGVEIQANQLVEAGFKGKVVIPVADAQKPFLYKAIINTGGNYLFNVQTASDLSFPLWQAGKVEIYKASYLEVKVQDGQFLPKANLHGRMSIQAKLSESGKGVELANIRFENLQIQSVRPYIQVGVFSFGSELLEQKMANFPVSISEIGARNISETELALDFRLKVNIQSAFAADAGLSVIGAMDSHKQWGYKDIEVHDISIDADIGAVKLNGKLIFYRNDKMYGDGFNGVLNAEFATMVKVKASAIFGNVNGERYWYADAMAEFKPGIPIVPGGVQITGFGGGAYYGMKMDNAGVGSDLGKTASGVVYIPDNKSGLGIKASIAIAAAAEEAFNAGATIEVLFYRGGGVRYISLMGNAFIATPPMADKLGKLKEATGKLMATMKKVESKFDKATMGLVEYAKTDESIIQQIHGAIGKEAGEKGAISAKLFIYYDFENRVLHGNFNVGINAAGGIIKGGGEAVLHFAPSEWYVYIGTPDNRFNLGIGIGPIRAQADAYFMVGTKIPGSPPPPAAVVKILGGGDYNYMKDLNAIGTGAGFAFGTSFSITTGDLQFLIFYARFDAGAGFDIMLKNYGDARCEGSGNRIGINGWYANGQAYAYFDGSVGIKVDLWFVSGKFEILSIGAAALLQAKLPNPTWFRGVVGGHFSILGGAVSGSCRFQVTLGSECKIIQKQENILKKIAVISQLTPAQGEKEVNVFSTPQAVFNMPVEKVFSLTEKGKQRSFRIKLDQFKFTDAVKQINGSLTWNDNKDVVAFNSIDVLPPKKDIKGFVQVSFEEQLNGAWTPVFFEGKKVFETSEVTFTTGTAPDNIPLSNVEYSYPVVNQLNYYKDETREGYIKLKKGQPYLFEPNPQWKQVGRMSSLAGGKSEFAISYSNLTVNYSTPADIQTNRLYSFELVNVPAQKAGAVDRNVSEVKNKVEVGGETTNTEIKTKKAEGSIAELQEKAIFSSYFKSSSYPSLSSKISGLNFSQGWTWAIQTGVNELGTTSYGPEFFDAFDFVGSTYDQDKLVQFEADVTGNNWYENFVYPLVYEGYPLNSKVVIRNRTKDVLGLPPLKSIYMRQSPSQRLLTNESILAGSDVSVQPVAMGVIYNLPLEMYRDYLDLQATVANLSVSESTTRTNKLLLEPFPVLRQGSYKINLKHTLPGTKKVTSVNPYTINYNIVFVK
jgi:hypothetical protein